MSEETTWGEFKKEVEKQNVTNDMTISYIDWSPPYDVNVVIGKAGGKPFVRITA
ncbi:hypothetical protein LCGC14_0849570 [marine sediment metagenome]|uniref:Uncharacterized protein n=1 Tax=marine sediment metagenome TaxID=412755 RepID=A0A0F9PFI8_9ZZZZ